MTPRLHFSVDVEDYVSLVARDCLGADVPVADSVEAETHRVLDLLDTLGVKATCFVVGTLALAKPDLVRELVARGHAIASHSHEHMWMPQHTPRSFAADLSASIAALEDVTGQPITGYRAPAFSLRQEHAWAFSIMAEQGITYDSSVHVVWPFGMTSAEGLIAEAAAHGIEERPGFALGWRGWRVPLGGGGGLRMVPAFVTDWAAKRIAAAGHEIPVYMHPYDLTTTPDIDWPLPSDWRGRLRFLARDRSQRLGRQHVAHRLRRLAEAGEAAPVRSDEEAA